MCSAVDRHSDHAVGLRLVNRASISGLFVCCRGRFVSHVSSDHAYGGRLAKELAGHDVDGCQHLGNATIIGLATQQRALGVSGNRFCARGRFAYWSVRCDGRDSRWQLVELRRAEWSASAFTPERDLHRSSHIGCRIGDVVYRVARAITGAAD